MVASWEGYGEWEDDLFVRGVSFETTAACGVYREGAPHRAVF